MFLSRRALACALGVLLLVPVLPGEAALAAAHPASHAPQAPRMTHDQAVAALQHVQALVRGPRTGARDLPRHPVDPTMALRDLAVALPSLDRAQRRTATTLLARPTDVHGDTDPTGTILKLDPAQVQTDETEHFSIHYVTTGDDAATPAFVQTVATTLEQAWSTEVDRLGYQAPPPDDPNPADVGNPDTKLDVYLGDIGSLGFYGYCTTANPRPTTPVQPAYCVLDNDFSHKQFPGKPLASLHATVAHEFFHAVQFGYDAFEDLWFMEGTAVWMERQVFADDRDYLQYARDSPITQPETPVDSSGGMHVYGAFVFFEYLSERLGRDAIRHAWQAAAATPTHNLYSLQAVRRTVATSGHDFTSFFATFARWNTLPPGSYALRSSYPRPSWWLTRTLSRSHPELAPRSRTLRHLSSADVQLRPATGLRRGTRLRIALNLPDASHGPAATVQVRYRNGHVRSSTTRLSRSGAAVRTVPFDPRTVRSVVVVLTNASTAMRSCGGSDQGYSCRGAGVYDLGQVYRISARTD